MRSIGLAQAKAQLSALLDAVASGDEEAKGGELLLKPLLVKGEERRVALEDISQLRNVLRTAT